MTSTFLPLISSARTTSKTPFRFHDALCGQFLLSVGFFDLFEIVENQKPGAKSDLFCKKFRLIVAPFFFFLFGHRDVQNEVAIKTARKIFVSHRFRKFFRDIKFVAEFKFFDKVACRFS